MENLGKFFDKIKIILGIKNRNKKFKNANNNIVDSTINFTNIVKNKNNNYDYRVDIYINNKFQESVDIYCNYPIKLNFTDRDTLIVDFNSDGNNKSKKILTYSNDNVGNFNLEIFDYNKNKLYVFDEIGTAGRGNGKFDINYLNATIH